MSRFEEVLQDIIQQREKEIGELDQRRTRLKNELEQLKSLKALMKKPEDVGGEEMEIEESETESETPDFKVNKESWGELKLKREPDVLQPIVIKQEIEELKVAAPKKRKAKTKETSIRSKYVGVTGFDRNGTVRWRAKRGTKKEHLDYFKTEKEAAIASAEFAKQIGNPKMKINFPSKEE